MIEKLNIKTPKGWRIGQTLKNFEYWLESIDSRDIFFLTDKQFLKYYAKLLKEEVPKFKTPHR